MEIKSSEIALPMIQCPACASFNEPEAAFCNQCGRSLSRARKRKAERRLKRRLEIGALAILLAVLALAIWRPFGGDPGSKDRRKPAAHRMALPFEPSRSKAKPQEDRPNEVEALTPEAMRRLVDPAIVLLDLVDQRGARLRETRGVLLEPAGTVLCRFKPLLGAYRGSCKFARAGEPNREIEGLIAYSSAKDLALLEIRSVESLSGLPVLQETYLKRLDAGADIAVASAGRVAFTQISDSSYPTPNGVFHFLLADDPAFASGAFLALDPSGGAIGLCAPDPSSAGQPGEGRRPRLLVDSLVDLVGFLGRPAILSLSEVSRRFYEGTFADYLDRGRNAYESQDLAGAVDLLQRALDQAEREQVGEEDYKTAQDLLRRAIEEELDRRRREKDPRGAANILVVAVVRFPQERRYWLELGAARLEIEDLAGAIEALLVARRLEPGPDAETHLQRAYLAGSAREISLGNLQVAAEWLEKGIQVLPGSAKLHLELARLYQRWGFYDDASRIYQMVRAMDPGLSPEVDAGLEEIEETIKRRESLVLKIPEGSTTIRTDDVVIDGRGTFSFIVDTGATYTAISREMAEALGYQLGPGLEQVLIGTANGVVSAPLILLESVSIGGYAVRNLKAVVLPQKARSMEGLLGLNFLDHFRYSVDAGRREFRLEKR